MIPVPLFSTAFFITIGVSFLAAVLVCVWVLVLALSSGARRFFGRYPGRCAGLLATLCLLSLPCIYVWIISMQVSAEVGREFAAKHPTLQAPARLRGIDMPAGSKLSLYNAKDMSSLEKAEFPHPVDIYGIPATSVEFRGERDMPALKLTVPTLSVIDGWRCSPSKPLEIVLPHDATNAALWSCSLAGGNTVAGASVPADSNLSQYNTVYTDGFHDKDYWVVKLANDKVFDLSGLPLRHPWLQLDKERNVMSFQYAELARETRVGDLTYPARTEVSWAMRGVREKYPGAWIFTPPKDQPTLSETQGKLSNGMSILQDPNGKIYGTLSIAHTPEGKTSVLIKPLSP